MWITQDWRPTPSHLAVVLPSSTWHRPEPSRSWRPSWGGPGRHTGAPCWPPSSPSSTAPCPRHCCPAGAPTSSPPARAAWPCCWWSSGTAGPDPTTVTESHYCTLFLGVSKFKHYASAIYICRVHEPSLLVDIQNTQTFLAFVNRCEKTTGSMKLSHFRLKAIIKIPGKELQKW